MSVCASSLFATVALGGELFSRRRKYKRECTSSGVRFPDLLQWTSAAKKRIVRRQRKRSNIAIGLRSFAWMSAQQIPIATFGISSDDTKIRAGTQVLMRDTRRNYDNVAGVHIERFAVVAANPQLRIAT